MIESFACPACGSSSWSLVGGSTFHRDPPPEDEYLALRYRVLFELWAPDQSSLSVVFVLCDGCGFVAYRPRASAAEVDDKYRFVQRHRPPRESRRHVTRLDRIRSKDILRYVKPSERRRVLDFGGGNGALLTEFVQAGHDCSVVDYTAESIPGVRRAGDTLEQLVPEERFDLIICCHVFEHLAEPVNVARALVGRLAEGGRLFVEVPLEIVGGPPALAEPVTHVNFFCESSLRATLERAGFDVGHVDTVACRFESGACRYAVRAVARIGTADGSRPLPGASEARSLLAETALGRLLRDARHPRRIWASVFG